MDQPTFADLEYQGKKRKTRRKLFLERMDGLIPGSYWRSASAPTIPRRVGDAGLTRWRSRCGFTVSSSFTISATREWRTCFTRPNRSGGS